MVNSKTLSTMAMLRNIRQRPVISQKSMKITLVKVEGRHALPLELPMMKSLIL